jgi:hypothetical protein
MIPCGADGDTHPGTTATPETRDEAGHRGRQSRTNDPHEHPAPGADGTMHPEPYPAARTRPTRQKRPTPTLGDDLGGWQGGAHNARFRAT